MTGPSGETERAEPWRSPSVVLATCLWLGRMPLAPGTWGAALGIPLSLASGRLAEGLSGIAAGAVAPPWIEAAVLASLNLAAVPICTAAARRLGRGSDPGAIVIDEAASLPVGLLVVPWADRTWPLLAAGWVLHRAFDIAKPFPCRRLERLPAGLGVMADDWAAAAWMAAGLLALRSLA